MTPWSEVMRIRFGARWLAIVTMAFLLGVISGPTADSQDRSSLRQGATPRVQAGGSTPARSATSERRARLRQGTQDPTDPTQPSEEIRSRLPAATAGTAAGQQARRQVRPQNMDLNSNLPQVPLITVQSRIMSSSDEGTVTLVASGDYARVKLTRQTNTDLHQFPELQFAEYAQSLRQLDRSRRTDEQNDEVSSLVAGISPNLENPLPSDTAPDTKARNHSEPKLPQEFAMERTFDLAGITYRLVDFNQDAILLEALPHGRLVIVR